MVRRDAHPRRDRGNILAEVVVALGCATTLAGSAVVATSAHFELAERAFERRVAERAAAARLEALSAGAVPLAPGERAFPLDPALADSIRGARGEERVRVLEPGLFEVEAAVILRGRPERNGTVPEHRVALTTLLAREEEGGR